jgi:hypothetical protein
MKEHTFTFLIMVLYAINTVQYAAQADWGRSLYWFAAIIITIAAMWLIK